MNERNRRGVRALVLAFLLAISGFAARAQAPAWQAAFGANELSGVRAMATDSAGNVFLTGYFSGTISLGPALLTSPGTADFFVAKWTPAAGIVWAVQGGGNDEDVANAIALRGRSVYVVGTFSSRTMLIGNSLLTNAGPTPPPVTTDAFVAKLTDLGTSATFDWAEQAGSPSYDEGKAVAVRGNDVYISGQFHGASLSCGASGITLTNAGTGYSSDGFVAKLVNAGTLGFYSWAQRFGGTGFDYANALVATATGAYVAGTFGSSQLALGSIRLINSGSSAGTDDAYVARFTDTGTTAQYTWAQRLGGRGNDRGEALAVSGNSLYLTGHFDGTDTQIGSATFYNAGPTTTTDAYVAKLTDTGSAGTVVWGQRAGGPLNDLATAVAAKGSSVYLTGNFQSLQADFGNTTLTNSNPVPNQGIIETDAFVARLADAGSTGAFAWAQAAGSANRDQGNAVAVAGATVHVAGTIGGPAFFGNVFVRVPVRPSVLFLASLADPVGLATRASARLGAVAVWPNPARAAATVRVPAVPGAAATLTLADGLGRVVRTLQLSLSGLGTTAELPLLGLAPGLYHLRVQAGDEQTSRTLAVE
ncbi:hypothetical protein [Hymenobacter convexus]|uniref:hypothetical protein n=1 Tax=Hymenobacter sp. CA1UV-4 TaxID=3063782 RepID=UPI0027141FE5|nr:hypothetical protein [Hymenobacter sp. CA1UV-4]MDO7852185.1 hypothetical protein [Hymenobacter sp. CA1UV-4]